METVNDILERYLAGETTLSEEQKLKRYFASDSVEPCHEWARMMFVGFEEIGKEQGIPQHRRIHTAPRWLRGASIAIAASVAIALTLTLTQKTETVYCYVNGEPVTELAVAERQAQLIGRIAGSGERIAMANVQTIESTAQHSSAVEKAMKYVNMIK